MKKVLLLLFCFVSSLNYSYAEYIPIPTEYKSQYKKEIELKFKKYIPTYKKEIQNVIKEVKKEKDPTSKNALIDNGIDGAIFDFYMDLINLTAQYVPIKDNVPPTDYSGTIYPILLPYFKDNNIDCSKLDSFLKYARKKQKEVEKKYIYIY